MFLQGHMVSMGNQRIGNLRGKRRKQDESPQEPHTPPWSRRYCPARRAWAYTMDGLGINCVFVHLNYNCFVIGIVLSLITVFVGFTPVSFTAGMIYILVTIRVIVTTCVVAFCVLCMHKIHMQGTFSLFNSTHHNKRLLRYYY